MNANAAKAHLTHPLQDRGVRLQDRGVGAIRRVPPRLSPRSRAEQLVLHEAGVSHALTANADY